MFKIKWPAEHDDALRTLAAQGKTNGEIARLLNEKFGTSYSRNAVIGRASRIGLVSQSGKKGNEDAASNLQTKQAREKRRLYYTKRKRSRSADDKIKIAARSNLPVSYLGPSSAPRIVCDAPIAPRDDGAAANLSLLDLTPHQCRWPSGDGIAVRFTFCGAPKPKGLPYCDVHQRIARRHAA